VQGAEQRACVDSTVKCSSSSTRIDNGRAVRREFVEAQKTRLMVVRRARRSELVRLECDWLD
jgi:hypothetical protein